MNEVQTTTKLLAIMAVIFVVLALVSFPYQNQVANWAAAGKKHQVYVTLVSVPANAGNLLVNATLNRAFFHEQYASVQSIYPGIQ